MKVKKGDKVIVIAGKHKGATSTIVRAFPKTDMVVLDKINMVKRHMRKQQMGKSGQIIEKAMPIHASNVQLVDPKTGKPTRITITKDKKGARTRVAVKSKQTL